MADRYWVGGTGTWDSSSTTHWSTSSGGSSGASAPTTSDNAIFDANSNTGTNDFTVTIGTTPSCSQLIVSGIDPANAMTVDGTGVLTVAGPAFTLTNKVSWTHTGTLTFTGAVGNVTVTSAGVSLSCDVTVNTTGSTVSLSGNLTTASTKTVTLTRGILSLGTYTLSAGAFSSTGSNSRTLAYSTNGNLTLTGNAATILTLTGTSLATNSVPIYCTYSGSTGTRTLNVAGVTSTLVPNIYVSAGSDTVVFTSANLIGALNFTGFTGTWSNVALNISDALTVSSGMTVGSGSSSVTFSSNSPILLTSNGKTLDFPIIVNAGGTIALSGNLTLGSTRSVTLTAGTLDLNNYNLTASSFSSTSVFSRLISFGSGTFTITGSGTSWSVGGATTMSTTVGTGTIKFTNAASKTFTAQAGSAYPTLDNASGGTLVLTSYSTFTTITNSVSPATFTFPNGLTQTVTNFTLNNATIQSNVAGARATISKSSGTVAVTGGSIKDIAATGGATWYANSSKDAGNNTGWIFTGGMMAMLI